MIQLVALLDSAPLLGALSEAKNQIQFVVQFVSAVVLTGLLCFLYFSYPARSRDVIARFQKHASNMRLCIATAMLLPLLVRLSLLPIIPPPVPHVQDEFGHLLVADTLAHGRLANPPHLLWRHFETIYILQRPTYSSSYPIGQGTILALGKALTGTPWAGVLLSVMLMSGATTWMLFGCLPPNWAATGGLLATIDLGLAFPWINSYWGGAFCAFGGALLFGALCRLHKGPSVIMGLLVGIGWSVSWLIRPFESVLLCGLVWAFFAVIVFRQPRLWKRWLGTILIVLSLQISAGVVTALHNRAVTGSFKTLPYTLSQRVYGVPQSLRWQRPIEEPILQVEQQKEMYQWQRDKKQDAETNPLRQYRDTLHAIWRFFITPWYLFPLLLLPFLFNDHDVLLGWGILGGAIAISGFYPFFFPHYIGAYACVIFYLIVRGVMVLYHFSFRAKPVGQLLAVFLIVGGLTLALRIVPPTTFEGLRPPSDFREQVRERLEQIGGQHVVFVRYAADHDFRQEWVYNAADVDASRIVWCRTMGQVNDVEVSNYYRDRRMWIVDVGQDAMQVAPYHPEDELTLTAAPRMRP